MAPGQVDRPLFLPQGPSYFVAEGKIKPMIVVMPYGHVTREIKTVTNPTGGPLATDQGVIEKELMTAIKPMAESKYRVLTDRDHRAIGGLSMGSA